jgi:hypothetical protein
VVVGIGEVTSEIQFDVKCFDFRKLRYSTVYVKANRYTDIAIYLKVELFPL